MKTTLLSSFWWTAFLVFTFPALATCQMNQDAVTTLLGKDTLAYLTNLTTNALGGPNARVSCTEGYHDAATFVALEMEHLGLEKFGNADRTTYFNVVPGSVDENFCPRGLKNVIGLVRGTDPQLAVEMLVYSAHLDGPNNYNEQTQPVVGNGLTTDVYDNALAVALGLAFAKKLAANPPKRSVLFIFDDGEEGWISVGTPPVGVNVLDSCWFSGKCTDQEREFYDRVSNASCPASLCGQDLFVHQYRGYPIGLNAWTKNPTVDLEMVKAALFGESLGPPPGMKTLIAIGGNGAHYETIGSPDGTMNDFLHDVLVTDDFPFTMLHNPRIELPNYGSLDSFAQYYEGLCGDNCRESGGIPSLQMTTLSQQRYHGGASSRMMELQQLFQGLTEDFPNLKATLNGVYPSPAYFSFDYLPSMDWARLDDLAFALETILVNSANSATVGNLTYAREPVATDPWIAGDPNMFAMEQTITDQMALTSDAFSTAMNPIIAEIWDRFEAIWAKGENMSEAEYVEQFKWLGYISSFVTLLDFFNESYETKIPFDEKYQRFDDVDESGAVVPSTTVFTSAPGPALSSAAAGVTVGSREMSVVVAASAMIAFVML